MSDSQNPDVGRYDPTRLETSGLHHDVTNSIMAFGYLDQDDEMFREDALRELLKGPLLTYEEYYRKHNPTVADIVISTSDKAKVAEYNRLIQAFNRQREVIIEQKDFGKMLELWKQTERLIRGA